MKVLNSPLTRRALIWMVLPLAVYTLVALIITWPLPQHLNHDAAGVGYGDTYMMIRGAWAANQALRAGHNPLDQTLLAYPQGFTSTLMWSTPLRWAPGALLMAVFSPLLAFNLWLIGTLVLNGMTAYWLGMELSDRHVPAALLGGLVFTAFPNMQGHLSVGHIDVLAMYALPLLALCLWRLLVREAGWRTAGWGGLWLALSCLGLTSQIIYNVLPLLLFMGLYALIAQRERLIRRDLPLRQRPWLKIAAMIALGGLILLIFFGPLLTSQGRAEIDAVRETGRVTFSADPLAFVSPSPFGPLDDLGLVPGYARDVLGTNSAEGAAYLGVVALVLAGIAVAARRESRGWLVVALGAMIFSLGPLLKWHDDPVLLHVEELKSYVTLPWAALEDLPIFESTRTPGRFNGATALAWGALACTGAAVALRRLRRREVQAVLAVVLGAAILFEYQLFSPYPTGSAAQPDYFRQLAKMDGVRGVLNVPLDDPPAAVMEAMFQQTIHGKPMVGGQLFRRTPQDPAVIAILNLATLNLEGNLYPVLPGLSTAEYALSTLGVDRVIAHKRFLSDPGPVMDNLNAMFGAPEYEDDRIAAFVVRHREGVPADTPIIARGRNGWMVLKDSGQGFDGIFLRQTGEWYFFAPNEFYADLYFQTLPYAIPRRVVLWLDDHLITAWWARGEAISLPLWLSPGFHTLRFEAPDGCDPYPFELACLDERPFSAACAPADPPYCLSVGFRVASWIYGGVVTGRPLHRLEVQMDQGVRLRAYEFYQDLYKPELHVRLYWAADHALSKSYALFVHLADPETGEPLAQYADYPLILTTGWGDDSRWQSDITIPLPDDLPAGEYAVNVGWFNPADNTRLAVHGERPWASAGMINLGMVKIK